MISQEQAARLYGRDLIDPSGNKIGTIGALWTDESGQPAWASVKTGLFGMNESLVPLHSVQIQGDQVQVPYTKDQVKDAPNVDASADEPLQEDEVGPLYQHYQLGVPTGSAVSGAETEGTTGHDISGPTTDEAMTRSEEQLHVGTQQQAVGRARLRKYIVTDQVRATVPVSHEEARVEREPITDANYAKAMAGPELSEEEHEVTLQAEQPVVQKETVPVERVRLATETVTEEQAINEEVRKERIEADLPDESNRSR